MGLDRARQQKKTLGRPRRIFDRSKALTLRHQGKSLHEIATELGIGQDTVPAGLPTDSSLTQHLPHDVLVLGIPSISPSIETKSNAKLVLKNREGLRIFLMGPKDNRLLVQPRSLERSSHEGGTASVCLLRESIAARAPGHLGNC